MMETQTTLSTAKRIVYASAGMICVALAIVGAVTPGLPTTVFAIAASYLFTRSSPTLDGWLRKNRWLGPSLIRFAESGGMSRWNKTAALSSMWGGLSISMLMLARLNLVLAAMAAALGVIGTLTVLFYVRTTVEGMDALASVSGVRE